MPVDNNHPDYDKYSAQWDRINLAVEGEDEIKRIENAEKIIPKLSGQDLREYQAYVNRSLFFPATGRTLEALTGFFEEPHIEENSEYLDDLIKNLTSDNKDLNGLFDDLNALISSKGRCCLILDTSPDGLGKPFISVYNASALVNWKVKIVEGREVITMLVFEEEIAEAAEIYDTKVSLYRRSFILNENGSVTVELYKKVEKEDPKTNSKYALVKTYDLSIRGMALNKILAVICNRHHLGAKVGKPTLIDLVNINMSHLRSSADLEHGRHYTALPTPWAAGFEMTKDLNIGSSKAWVSPDPQAHAAYLEFTGQGLKALETALEEKQKMMAIVGTRILDMDKLSAESEDTLRIRKSSENNVIDKQANIMSQALSQILTMYLEMYNGLKKEIKVNVARKQIDPSLSPQMLTALMGQVQSGLISWDSYFEILQKGQIIPVDRSKEKEKSLIEQGTPSGFGALHGDNGGGDTGGIATDSQNITRNSNPTRVVNRSGSNTKKGKQ